MTALIPPDPKQCQAEKPNGNNAFTLGGVPGLIRCTNKPTVIATEKKLTSDGQIGSMSLCDDCQNVFIKQLGEDYANFEPVVEAAPAEEDVGLYCLRTNEKKMAIATNKFEAALKLKVPERKVRCRIQKHHYMKLKRGGQIGDNGLPIKRKKKNDR